jgi:hypothetical protein
MCGKHRTLSTCVFGSVARKGVMGAYFGSVANTGVSEKRRCLPIEERDGMGRGYLPLSSCKRVRNELIAKKLSDAHFVAKIPRVRDLLILKRLRSALVFGAQSPSGILEKLGAGRVKVRRQMQRNEA